MYFVICNIIWCCWWSQRTNIKGLSWLRITTLPNHPSLYNVFTLVKHHDSIDSSLHCRPKTNLLCHVVWSFFFGVIKRSIQWRILFEYNQRYLILFNEWSQPVKLFNSWSCSSTHQSKSILIQRKRKCQHLVIVVIVVMWL